MGDIIDEGIHVHVYLASIFTYTHTHTHNYIQDITNVGVPSVGTTDVGGHHTASVTL